MADTHQTLFSFELFVEYVRIDGTRKIHDVEPAVAMRLLDFPTLLIYRSENEDPFLKTDSEKVHLVSETFSEESNFAYYFKKGKSCLFKMNLNSLHTNLLNTPLYVMLLDVRRDIPKLIGSSYISLAKRLCRIKQKVEKRGIWTPTFHGEKVINPVLNLMGERVGEISLAYKIVNLGEDLDLHISESRRDEMNVSLKPTTSTENSGAHGIQPCLSKNINAHLQPVCFNNQPTEILCSKAKLNVAAVTTQTEHIKKKDLYVVNEEECDGDELLCSTFCPPPLFYSSSKTEVKNHQLRAAEMKRLRMTNLNSKYTEDENYAEMECTYQVNRPKGDEQDKVYSDVGVQHNNTVPSVLGDATLQFPLLNALIVELSQLNGQIHKQQNPSVPPTLLRLCTSAEPSLTPASRKEDKTEILKMAGSPIQTVVQSHSPRQSNTHVPLKGQQKRPYHNKFRYGLTHTFHPRLKQVKRDMTKHHECTDHLQIKQLESQKNTSYMSKRYNSTGQMLKRDQIESFEKLFSDLEIDPAPFQVIPNLKKKTCKNLIKPSIFSNSLKAKGFCYKSDKKVQVHIPSSIRQNSDHNGECSACNDHTSFHYQTQTDSGMLSSRENDRENSRPYTSSRPASSHDGVESDEYQDDFTSLNHTEGSPEPLSTPEPGKSRRGQFSSGRSSFSNSFYENTSCPVLVKMSHSPTRSLKGTHVIKSQLKTSVLSTSSDDIMNVSASISTSSKYAQRSPESKSFPRCLNVSTSYKRSKSVQSDYAEENAPIREQSVDKFVPSNDFVLESVSSPEPDEERNEFAYLTFGNKNQPISDLVISKLPGYTL